MYICYIQVNISSEEVLLLYMNASTDIIFCSYGSN